MKAIIISDTALDLVVLETSKHLADHLARVVAEIVDETASGSSPSPAQIRNKVDRALAYNLTQMKDKLEKV